MKRLALALIIGGAGLLVGSAFSGAGVIDAYPPTTTVAPTTVAPTTAAPTTGAPTTAGPVTVTVSNLSPAPGGQFTVTVSNCQGQAVFTLGSSTATVTPVNGTATATLTAPTTPGSFTGTVVCANQTASFTVNVAAPGGLPATGSSGLSTTTAVALVLLVTGIGIFVVTQARRRSTGS